MRLFMTVTAGSHILGPQCSRSHRFRSLRSRVAPSYRRFEPAKQCIESVHPLCMRQLTAITAQRWVALRQLADALDSHFGAGEEIDDPSLRTGFSDSGR